jgi:transposase
MVGWGVAGRGGRGSYLRPAARGIRARRGNKIAVVACARKLAALFWCLLTRGEDYAHQQPSLTAKKLRLLEIRAGAPTLKGKQTGTWATRQQMRTAERELAQQPRPPTSGWSRTGRQRRRRWARA